MRPGVVAQLAMLAAGGTLLALICHHIPQLILRHRIHSHLKLLHALREHALAARSLAVQLSDHPLRQRALRKVQKEAIARLADSRAMVDDLLLLLHSYRAGVDDVQLEMDYMRGRRAAQDFNKSRAALAACEARARSAVEAERAHASRILGSSDRPWLPGRSSLLESEQQTLANLESGKHLVNSQVVPLNRVHKLRRVMHLLRRLETDVDFQAELLVQQLRMSSLTRWSRSNFAYGSTPLSSFLALLESEPVQAILCSTPTVELSFVVLGSSVGWLCFYVASVYGIPARGIELLPNLVNTAERIAHEVGIESVSFECNDVLKADLRGSKVLVLTSQCWDLLLITSLRSKLLKELPEGALIIDYTPMLGETCVDSHSMRALNLVCNATLPVSWDGAHTFWIWRVDAVS